LFKKAIPDGVTSSVVERMSKYNDGKKPGWGYSLLALSAGGKFTLIKDGIEYQSKTLKELKEEFTGYIIETQTWFKFIKGNL